MNGYQKYVSFGSNNSNVNKNDTATQDDAQPALNSSETFSNNMVYAKHLNGRFQYDNFDHFSVIFTLKGSVWPKVFGFCIANTIFTALILYGRETGKLDLTFNDKGHSFLSILTSFLVVTRSSVAYKRYCQASNHLMTLMMSSRELVQYTVAYTRNENSPQAQEWRIHIARRIIAMLRCVIFVLQYDSNREKVYYNHTLMNSERQALSVAVGEANERTPNVLVIFLRSTIASHVKCLETPLPVNKELQLLYRVSDFIKAYNGLMKLEITPFPFPLVQMTRTILFVWVLTLPLGMGHDFHTMYMPCFITFFVTFGFLGLEFVTIEMDNPFGRGPINFDILSMARVVFDDIFINIHDIDGKEASDKLKKMTKDKLAVGIKKSARGHSRSLSKLEKWHKTELKKQKETEGLERPDPIASRRFSDPVAATPKSAAHESYQNNLPRPS